MKKTLLTFVAFFAMMTMALAQTITWNSAEDWKGTGDKAEVISYTSGDYTLTASKEDGLTVPTVNGRSNDLRVYAKGKLTVSATKNFSKLVFNLSAQSKKRLAEIAADGGQVVVDKEANILTWTGDAKQLVLTVGDTTVYGSETGKAGQFCIASIVVGEGGGVTPEPEPEPQPDASVVFTETFAEGIGTFVIEDKQLSEPLKYVWKHDNHKYMKASAFIFDKTTETGACYAAESWLVSPVIDLTGKTGAALSFEHAANKYFKNPVTDFCVVKVKAEGGDWTNLTYSGVPTGENWDFVQAEADLKAYEGKKIQLAFVYLSNTKVAGTWEVKNVKVTANTQTGVESVEAAAGEQVIYDMSGRRVAKAVKGLYIINGKKVYVK